jgi:murein L,D-transpeptidase YafK
VKIIIAALLLTAIGYFAFDYIRVDSCLDSDGMWAGPMGCRSELPDVDRILIDKSERRLVAFERGRAVAVMNVALGRQPVGDKLSEGDNKTPEGTYPITAHKYDSSFHRALRLGYPTPAEFEKAKRDGRKPGGDIMIHGIRNGFGWVGGLHHIVNWTRGCVAVTDGEIDWLYQSARDGTPVEIRA